MKAGISTEPSKDGSTHKGRRPKLDMDELLTRIVKLLVRHHPSDLSFSRISRLTGVPRPTLYYYFGNSLETLIKQAVLFGGKALMGLHRFDKTLKEPDWNSFQKKRLHEALEISRMYPWAPSLYFRFRGDNSYIGESVRDLEEKYCEKMVEAWRHYHSSEPDFRAVRLAGYLKLGVLFGISAEPELWYAETMTAQSVKLLETMNLIATNIMTDRF